MKKQKRERELPTLKEREEQKQMQAQAKAESTKKKPRGTILPFDPNAPVKLVSKTRVYIVSREALQSFPWKKLAFTFFVILICGVGSAAFQARNTNIQTEINRLDRELRTINADNFALESRLQDRSTFAEIERIATERLGMSFPDASQVRNIYVPRVGGVTLNTADYALPQHNYFWNDVREFLTGFFNQLFGG
ncbi:MAG: hypothetical protein FWB80_03160 [Defluviitaleaceae bacterium]|nr:hypothetical protein [Defluviitaleaceae bacterium]